MKHSRHYYLVPFACAGWLLTSLPASGAILGTYTNRALWEAATSGRTDIDFESLGLVPPPGMNFSNYSTAAGLTLGGATFTGWTGGAYYLYAVNPPAGADEDFGSATLLRGPEWFSGSYLQIALPLTVTSFGLDVMTMTPGAGAVRILADGIDVAGAIATALRPTRTFFGFTSDTPIAQVRVIIDTGTVFQTQVLVDNVSFGAATSGGGGGGGGGPAETAEITTLIYVASGVALLAWAKRRITGAAAAA
jgi:hypothetical protein